MSRGFKPLDGAVVAVVVGALFVLVSTARSGSEGRSAAATTTTDSIIATTLAPTATVATSESAALPPASVTTALPSTTATKSLAQKVAALPVEPEHVGGYDRDLFEHWSDFDGDGCNTRSEVLTAESLEPVTKKDNCTVLTGRWWSAYDGFEFTSASDIDIDHVVALSEAWGSGAWAWDAGRREAFANDTEHDFVLIAVTDDSNQSKADKDPAQWMPSVRGYWCTYLRAWVDTKLVWGLSVDEAERAALAERAASC